MARTLTDHLSPDTGKKRILALDGGGVKGVLTLGILRILEAELRRRSGDPTLVLSDYYDLIGGTSTGAIIASGLALGRSTHEATEMYMKMGPDVFGKTVGDGIFIQAKFDSRKLRRALSRTLSTKSLGSPEIRTGVAICMKRIDTGSAWVLTNHPESKFWDTPPDSGIHPNKRYRLIDVVLASAAAPTFFDEVVIDIVFDERNRPIEKGYFLDGAVSGNNNPSIQFLMLALEPSYAFRWKPGADNLMMTSCGTGLRRPRVDGPSFQGLPPGVRGVHALRSMIYDTQIQGVMMMQAISEPKKPWIINSEIGGMEGHCISGAPILDYQRIDVILDQKPRPRGRIVQPASTALEKLLDRALPWDTMEALDQMANGKPDNMSLLLEVGECVGKQYINATYPDPKFDLPGWGAGAPG